MDIHALTDLDPAWQEALRAAKAVRDQAYAPYSRFHVGAGIITSTGELFTGANVENASYGLAICAERSAAVTAVSQGVREFSVVAVTATHRDLDVETPVSPCGACRQFLFEFKPREGNLIVLMANSALSQVRIMTIDELLPAGFGPELDA